MLARVPQMFSVKNFQICHVTETPAMLNQKNLFLGEKFLCLVKPNAASVLFKIFSAMKSLCIWIRNNCDLTILLLSLLHSALDEVTREYFSMDRTVFIHWNYDIFSPRRLIIRTLLFSPPHLCLLRWMLINAIGYVKWAVHFRTAPWWSHLFPRQKEKRKYFEE